jgi:hypothetical protein
MKRHLLILAAMVLCVSVMPLHAADEFDAAVSRLGDRIGHRPMRIPFLGLMLYFTPARGTHLKLATFENVHTSFSLADLEASLQGSLTAEWHPFVKVDSRRNHESTLIYARAAGSSMRLMIINAEQGEVNVIEMDLSKDLQKLWLNDTRHEAHHQAHNSTEHGDDDHDGA